VNDAALMSTLAATMLVSVWKPILFLIPLIAWAWLVSTVFDKHAKRFFLGQEGWNIFHFVMGCVAAAAAFFMFIPGILGFIVGFVVMCLILAIDVVVFVQKANRDERVPETSHLRLDFSEWEARKAAKRDAALQGDARLNILDAEGHRVNAPQKETPEHAIRLAAEQVYLKAKSLRASQVDVVPASQQANTYAASYLVDGVRQPGDALPAQDAVRIIDFWKAAAKLDVNDRRRTLAGECKAGEGANEDTLGITASGGQRGMTMTMVFNPKEAVRRKPEELGLHDQQFAELKELVAEGTGIVLLATPSDGGRTTLSYAVTRMHDAYTSNVQTIETHVESDIEGVRQIAWTPDSGQEFAIATRSALRRDPDVLLVQEVPDQPTSMEIVKADHDRTRIYVCLRAPDAVAAMQVWAKIVGDAGKASEHLRGVLCGRLMRKLCENCKIAYPPSPDMLKKLGIPEGKVQTLFKKGGQVLIKNKPEVCPVCGGLGYYGQTGVFEVVKLDSDLRELMHSQDWDGLRTEMRKRGTWTIQNAALRKALEGTSSLEEVTRVTAPPKKRAPGKPQQAATPTA